MVTMTAADEASLGSARIQLSSALRLATKDKSDLVSVPLSVAEIRALLTLSPAPEGDGLQSAGQHPSTGWREGRDAGLEEGAAMVDRCNREGPYNAIGAADRIRALKYRPLPPPPGEQVTSK